jgi:hypothetical protein
MSDKLDATLIPRFTVARPELVGAWIATAADVGMTVDEIGGDQDTATARASRPVRPIRLDGSLLHRPCRLRLVNAVFTCSLTGDDGSSCRVVANSDRVNWEKLNELARDLSARFARQLVYRRLIRTLRAMGSTLLERQVTTHVLSVRVRFPSLHPQKPSARTAPPDFEARVGADGRIACTWGSLRRDDRELVARGISRAVIQPASGICAA